MKLKVQRKARNRKISCIILSAVMINIVSNGSLFTTLTYAALFESSKVLDFKFNKNVNDTSSEEISSVKLQQENCIRGDEY